MAAQKKSVLAQAAAKPRLVADPTVGMGDIMDIYRKFIKAKGSKDLWSLVQPGPSGPRTYTFKSRPNAEWMMNTAELIYDMLDIAQNTKVASKKNRTSLRFHGF